METIVLNSTDSLAVQISSGSPSSASPITVIAQYADDVGGSSMLEGNQVTSFTSQATSTIVNAPSAGTSRLIREITIKNSTTSTAHFKLGQNTGGSSFPVIEKDITTLDTWQMSQSNSSVTTFSSIAPITVSGTSISFDLSTATPGSSLDDNNLVAVSTSAGANKPTPWSVFKSALKTYFDAIYMAIVAPGTSGNVLTSNGSFWTSATPTGGGSGGTNYAINGDFIFFNRQLSPSTETAYSDGAYCMDRIILLTQTTSASVSRQSGDTNSKYCLQIKQSAATPQRIGALQKLENFNSIPLRNKDICASVGVSTSASAIIRFAILDMGSQAANVVVSDVVADWTSTTYAAGGFFIASGSCNVIASGSIISGSAVFTPIPITGVSGSSLNNIALFVWSSDVLVQNTTLKLVRLGVYSGTTAPSWDPRPETLEEILCKRYCRSLTPGAQYSFYWQGWVADTNNFRMIVPLTPSMFSVPTLIPSAASDFWAQTLANYDVSSLNIGTSSTNENLLIYAITTGGPTIGATGALVDKTGNSRIVLSAEI